MSHSTGRSHAVAARRARRAASPGSAVPPACTNRVRTGTGRPVSSEAVKLGTLNQLGALRPDRGQSERQVCTDGAGTCSTPIADGICCSGDHMLPTDQRRVRRPRSPPRRRRSVRFARPFAPGQLGTAHRPDGDQQRTREHDQPVQAADVLVVHVVGPHPHRQPDHGLGTDASDERGNEYTPARGQQAGATDRAQHPDTLRPWPPPSRRGCRRW